MFAAAVDVQQNLSVFWFSNLRENAHQLAVTSCADVVSEVLAFSKDTFEDFWDCRVRVVFCLDMFCVVCIKIFAQVWHVLLKSASRKLLIVHVMMMRVVSSASSLLHEVVVHLEDITLKEHFGLSLFKLHTGGTLFGSLLLHLLATSKRSLWNKRCSLKWSC